MLIDLVSVAFNPRWYCCVHIWLLMEQIHFFLRWCCRGRAFLIMIIAALTVIVNTTNMAAMADTSSKDDKDLQECAQQLAGLSTCLTFVQGQAKAPTPDCCSGLKQVLKEDRKCLCVIVVHRSDPQLGLNINATLALSLPTLCAAPANVSLCPALLHLAPDSAEAQVFLQFAKNSSRTTSAPTANSRSTENITNVGAHEQKSGDDGSTQKTALQFWVGIIFGLLVANIL